MYQSLVGLCSLNDLAFVVRHAFSAFLITCIICVIPSFSGPAKKCFKPEGLFPVS